MTHQVSDMTMQEYGYYKECKRELAQIYCDLHTLLFEWKELNDRGEPLSEEQKARKRMLEFTIRTEWGPTLGLLHDGGVFFKMLRK